MKTTNTVYKRRKSPKSLSFGKLPKALTALVIVAVVLFEFYQNTYSEPLITDGGDLVIEMIDVGQGDSIFLIQGGETLLIDTNTNKYYDDVRDTLKKYDVKKLDYLLATHPHADHIGSMAEVLEDFGSKFYYFSDYAADTYTYKKSVKFAREYADNMEALSRGDYFMLGNAKLSVLSPKQGYDDENTNNSSIVLLLEYGTFKALFMGDAEKEVELEILPAIPDVDLLKIGHHGSYTSSSEDFLKTAKPEIALISLGEGNEYGFPHQIVLDRLEDLSCDIYRTDLDNDITVTVSQDGTYTIG